MPTLRVVNAWLSGELAEARGDDQCAAEYYKEGLALPSTPDDIPLHRARLEQAYGRLLARTGERRLAETWLHHAADGFTALGARPFLDRCNAVLGSLPTGPRVAPRPPELVLSPLTDRERDIAHLVSLGLTNNEIAAELFISVKTVEYHLGHIYQKFGFTSRRQLRDHIHG